MGLHVAAIALVGLVQVLADDCASFSARDALLVIDVQNSFLESRPVQSAVTPQYPIPPSEVVDGNITAGSLAIDGSAEVVEVVNGWMSEFVAQSAHVFTSKDWHPPNHCSFCRNGTEETNPAFYHPHGAVCVSGKDVTNFNASNRCLDSVSTSAYKVDDYYQWPDHCMQNTFGSEYGPYLQVPPSAVLISKGFEPTLDSYSAFGGIELSPPNMDLKAALENRTVERLWVSGVATDFCVMQSTLDALGKNPQTGRPPVETLKDVILVLPATRGVTPAGHDRAVARMVASGAHTVTASDPVAALKEFCARGK